MKTNRKQENEYLDNVINTLGYVVVDIDKGTVDMIDTEQGCKDHILSFFQIDAQMREMGIDKHVAESLRVASIKDVKIHRSTLRALARDYLFTANLIMSHAKPADITGASQ